MILPGWLIALFNYLFTIFDAGGLSWEDAHATAWGIVMGIAVALAYVVTVRSN